MGKFEVIKRKSNEFHFNLKAGNGQVILTSESYTAKDSCINGINSVKRNASDDTKYDRKHSSNGKWYFNLKASNGQVIGTSEMYESAASCEKGIESVKKNAPEAEIVEKLS